MLNLPQIYLRIGDLLKWLARLPQRLGQVKTDLGRQVGAQFGAGIEARTALPSP